VKNQETIFSYVALCRTESENNYNYQKCDLAKLIAGTEIKTKK
jgi:hypothetical protein